MNNKKWCIKAVVLFASLSIVSYFLFHYSLNRVNKKPLPIPKHSIAVFKDIYIVPDSKKRNLETQTHSITIINNMEKTENVLHTSNTPTSIAGLGSGKSFLKKGDTAYFVLFDYTNTTSKNLSNSKHGFAYLYQMNKNGDIKKIYTTHFVFDKAQIEKNSLMIYEKIYKDDMNIYPSYYKPYISIKSELKNGKLVEIGRKSVDPTY